MNKKLLSNMQDLSQFKESILNKLNVNILAHALLKSGRFLAFIMGVILALILKYGINYQDTPAVLMNIGIGLITILIAVVIFILNPLQDENKSKFFDKAVILNKVIKPYFLIKYTGFIFIPLIFWHESNIYLDIILFLISFRGIIGFVAILYHSYMWAQSYNMQTKTDTQQQYRKKYLEDLSHVNELEEVFGNRLWGNDSSADFDILSIEVMEKKF
ncbi:MAG: hypothetical protein ACK4PR_13180 [Gammaproteobacteria bacterium]